MSVIKIREAKREGARLVVGLSGISGGGKTYTALQLAWGLANFDSKKVGLLDTENRRGSLYANSLVDANGVVHPFLVGDLEPPFSPKRYVDAIQEFQRAGVEVLVIDSVTHEWEGTGGCEEIAHAENPRMPNWALAKREHKTFVNALLQSNMHIIVCVRAREKVDMKAKDDKGRTIVKSLGIQPVTEKNFMFEMTASMMIYDGGKQREVLKSGGGVEDIFGSVGWAEGYLSSQHGKALRDWVDGGAKLDPEIELARNTLRTISEKGLTALESAFTALPAKVKRALKADGTIDTLKTAATAFDAQRAASKPGGAALDSLNDQVGI